MALTKFKLVSLLITAMAMTWNEGILGKILGAALFLITFGGDMLKIIQGISEAQDAIDWNNKGIALSRLGSTTEADVAFARAKELGYKD